MYSNDEHDAGYGRHDGWRDDGKRSDGGNDEWSLVGLAMVLLGWAWVLALIVLIVITFVWTLRRASRPALNPEAPMEILKRRFARGEVSPEQFEAMKRQLSES